MDGFLKSAKKVNSLRFNWIDLTLIGTFAGGIFLLREMFFPHMGSFMKNLTRSFLVFPFLFCFFNYAENIRPILFSNEKINTFLLLPKPVKNRKSFTILGTMAVLFQWCGCLLMVSSPLWGPWSIDELELSTNETITKMSKREAERLLLHEQMKGLAEAKPINTDGMSAVEIHQLAQKIKNQKIDPVKEKEEAEKYKKDFIEKKSLELFSQLRKETHEEEQKDHQEKISFAWSQLFRFFRYGIVMLMVGGIVDKINNIIQIRYSSKGEV